MGKIEVYRDRKKQWRWRIVAKNGRKLANCGEGYRRRMDAVRGIAQVGVITASKGPIFV